MDETMGRINFDETTAPRPLLAEINRVHNDLARALSDADQDDHGRRAISGDMLRAQLKSAGHTPTAIEWAIYLLREEGLIRTTTLSERLAKTNQDAIHDVNARAAEVPAVVATDEFWKWWQDASRTPLALVMKGGGVKGLSYVGALDVLGKEYKFNWFIGTSAGAITAILLAAGYTHCELLEIMRDEDFRDFFDAKWYQQPFNLLFHKGLHHSYSFTTWMDTLLAEKLNRCSRVRLSDLPNRVTVYASQRGTGALKFDSIDNDAHAAYAARCSMSIPWVFVPQFYQGLRTYDGGIQHNYPVDRLLEDYPGTKFVSLYLGPAIYEAGRPISVLDETISISTEGSDSDATGIKTTAVRYFMCADGITFLIALVG